MSQSNDVLQERYGRSTEKRKPWVVVGVALLASVFFSFAIYASFLGKPVASAELTSYEQIDATHIKGNFTALTGDTPATCVFKAYNAAGAIVGYSEVLIPANNDDTRVLSIVVKTVVPASVMKADGCSVK